jgi:hypothetical protein
MTAVPDKEYTYFQFCVGHNIPRFIFLPIFRELMSVDIHGSKHLIAI